MRENSDRKIVGLYFNGHFMTNIKHWSLYYCGKTAMKILNKKKYKDYIKRIYIDISEPEAESFDLISHNILDIICSHMIIIKTRKMFKLLLIAQYVKDYV